MSIRFNASCAKLTIAAGLSVCACSVVQANKQPSTFFASAGVAQAVALCLDHLVGRDPVERFRAEGFAVNMADEGTFEFAGAGVSGFLAPVDPTAWCWVQSEFLTLEVVQDITHGQAIARYPSGVPGRPERGELADGCPSMIVQYAGSGRLALLEFRNAGFFNGCSSAGTGGVLFR